MRNFFEQYEPKFIFKILPILMKLFSSKFLNSKIFQDLRQLPNRQLPVGSSAVRALGGFGNGMGGSSRPLTPTPLNLTSVLGSGDNSYILSQKLGKVMADRQNAAAFQQPISSRPISNEDLKSIDTENLPNGKNDSWKEDQEVSLSKGAYFEILIEWLFRYQKL